MAAPSGITWGSTVTGSKSTRQGKLGIYKKLTTTATKITVHVEVWVWCRYAISDVNNELYADWTDEATTNRGSKNVEAKANSGSGWSTSNQIKLADYTKEYTRNESAKTEYFSAKLTGIDLLATMTHSISFTIAALSKYTISYDGNGGIGEKESDSVYHGSGYSVEPNVFTYDHHTFAGWNSKADGSGIVYGTSIASVTSNITLYAQWKADSHKVAFNGNGGFINGSEIETRTITYGEIIVGLPEAVKEGSKFVGWNSKADGSGEMYTTTIEVLGDMILYAIYSEDNNAYVKTAESYKLGETHVKVSEYEVGEIYVRTSAGYRK